MLLLVTPILTPSNPMDIREASLQDIPELADLLALLFAQEADFWPDPTRQREGLRQIISQPDVGKILLARQQGRVVGMVNLLFTISTAEGGRVAWLEDMVLYPCARGKGLGGALLDAAIALAKAQGCSRITLLTDDGNDAAQSFYQSRGFAPSAMRTFRLQWPKI